MPLLRRLLPLLPFALLGGCRDDPGQDEAGVGTPPPPATTAAPGITTGDATSEATTGSTGAASSACDCASEQFCAAPHQGGITDPDDERLVYACQAECVIAEDPAVWCRVGEPSCCAGLECDTHGFCVDPSAAGSESSAGATATSSGSGTGTESSSGGAGSGTTAGTSGSSSGG